MPPTEAAFKMAPELCAFRCGDDGQDVGAGHGGEDRRSRSLEHGGVDVEERESRAFMGRTKRGGVAETGSCSGDHDHLVLQTRVAHLDSVPAWRATQ